MQRLFTLYLITLLSSAPLHLYAAEPVPLPLSQTMSEAQKAEILEEDYREALANYPRIQFLFAHCDFYAPPGHQLTLKKKAQLGFGLKMAAVKFIMQYKGIDYFDASRFMDTIQDLSDNAQEGQLEWIKDNGRSKCLEELLMLVELSMAQYEFIYRMSGGQDW